MSTGNGSRALHRYDLRDEKGAWLGCVVISDDGFFSTVSDYGNYAYWWGGAGEEFRRFLCRLEPDYICGKLSSRHKYDGDATLRGVKRAIVAMRRRMDWTKGEAREEWDLLDEHSSLEGSEWFAIWTTHTKLGDAYEHATYVYPSDVRAFAERVWPALVKRLQAEMADEATVKEVEA